LTTTDTPKRRRKTVATTQALQEIDARLTAALQERSAAIRNVAELENWQNRLRRVTEEIEQLISYQQRLSAGTTGGTTVAPVIPFNGTGPTHSFQNDLPPNVGSIPSRLPKAGPGNFADTIKEEGGFA
jgi:hypothetical protein